MNKNLKCLNRINFLGDELQNNSCESIAHTYDNQTYYYGTNTDGYGKHICIKKYFMAMLF